MGDGVAPVLLSSPAVELVAVLPPSVGGSLVLVGLDALVGAWSLVAEVTVEDVPCALSELDVSASEAEEDTELVSGG